MKQIYLVPRKTQRTKNYQKTVPISWRGFHGDSDGKESACKVGDLELIPGWEDPLEKGKATQSSILVWKTPWTEEPGRLLTVHGVKKRVRQDWTTDTHTHITNNQEIAIQTLIRCLKKA